MNSGQPMSTDGKFVTVDLDMLSGIIHAASYLGIEPLLCGPLAAHTYRDVPALWHLFFSYTTRLCWVGGCCRGRGG